MQWSIDAIDAHEHNSIDAHEHNFRGSNGHRGSMFDVSLTLLYSDIRCSKGERLFRGRSKAIHIRGSSPKEDFKQGEQPQDENGPFPLMSKGES
jgi:hypothetical protein